MFQFLGEAEGHVVLFETVVPICPPACDGYNYSSGTIGIQAGITLTAVTLFSILYFLKLR